MTVVQSLSQLRSSEGEYIRSGDNRCLLIERANGPEFLTVRGPMVLHAMGGGKDSRAVAIATTKEAGERGWLR